MSRSSGPSAGLRLLHGASFALLDGFGEIVQESDQGVYVMDTRCCSGLRLELDGMTAGRTTVSDVTPSSVSVAVQYSSAGAGRPLLRLRRQLRLDRGLHQEIFVTSGATIRRVGATVTFAVDFQDVFEVRGYQTAPNVPIDHTIEPDRIRFHRTVECGEEQAVEVSWSPGWSVEAINGEFRIKRMHDIPVGTSQLISLAIAWAARAPVMPTDTTERAAPVASITSSEEGIERTLAQSRLDIQALKLTDPEYVANACLAAGAPWYMTLFGRDALLSAWFALLLDPLLAINTLEALALRQGTKIDDRSQEQPGRIHHELRLGRRFDGWLARPVYYGTVDATPLFVMLLNEAERWGTSAAAIDALLPSGDRCLEWMDRFGDVDGDGFIEMQPHLGGLVGQSWKDSPDAIQFADGTIAMGSVAVAEAQGYAYAAWRARAELARRRGDHPMEHECERRAHDLRARFDASFWLEDRGYYALALDPVKRRVDALASNLGHLLWTGIVSTERASSVADALMSDDLRSGWGVRTLGASMAGYDPRGYHTGSVWPHDTAIAIAGLSRYGFRDEARALASDVFAVAEALQGRLPEVVSGDTRINSAAPDVLPMACSPQAWAASAPYLILRSLLGLNPEGTADSIELDPALPKDWGSITITSLRIGNSEFECVVTDNNAEKLTPDAS